MYIHVHLPERLAVSLSCRCAMFSRSITCHVIRHVSLQLLLHSQAILREVNPFFDSGREESKAGQGVQSANWSTSLL